MNHYRSYGEAKAANGSPNRLLHKFDTVWMEAELAERRTSFWVSVVVCSVDTFDDTGDNDVQVLLPDSTIIFVTKNELFYQL